MDWFTAGILYVLIWWVALFAVLPFGTRPVSDADLVSGGWRGAPERPHLLRTAVATTIVTTLIWVGCMVVILHKDWLSFRSGWLALPGD